MLLNRTVAFFMMLIFMAQSFSNLFLFADYYMNTAAFAEQCVNKNKPQMHCNGQCQLSKRVETENKRDQGNPERKAENKIEALSSKNFFTQVESINRPILKKQYPFFNTGKFSHHSPRIFHPPCA